MTAQEKFSSEEKSRICPSCRCQISILAVKCRFCGEEVGKPKEEQRVLSINDLGGEEIHHRAASANVASALEAFRVDQGDADETEESEVPGVADSGILDDDMSLGDMGFGDTPSTGSTITSHHKAEPTTFVDRLKTIGIVVAVLLVLAVVGGQVPKWLSGMDGPDAKARVETYVNPAPNILSSGGSTIKALEAAVEAIGHEDSGPNRKIAEDVVNAIEKEVNGYLNASPFNEPNLRKASKLASQASGLFPNNTTLALKEDAQRDNRLYKMFLSRISKDGVATFKLNEPGNPSVEVKQGDTLSDRFTVHTIVGTYKVTLKDTERGNRLASYEIGKAPY